MILDLAAAAVGGSDQLRQRPFFIAGDSPFSPLHHSKEAIEKMMFFATMGLPCNYNPMPQAGLTAPATMAGALVIALAELLTCLVVVQLANPGCPFTCGGTPSNFDMRDSTFVYGSPESYLMGSAWTDILHHYNLPSFGTAGVSNAKRLDLQAATEASLSSLMSVLSRSNLIHDVGLIDVGVHSLPMVVLVDEIIGMVQHIAEGIEVTPQTLAVDLIDKVGPQGSFIAEEHTYENYKKSWYPVVFDHSPRGTETKEIAVRLRQRIDHILGHHVPAELPAQACTLIKTFAERWTSSRHEDS